MRIAAPRNAVQSSAHAAAGARGAPHMSRLVFRDFDEFADSIAGVAGRFVPTARSSTEWWIDLVPAGALSLQHLQIGGYATFAGVGQTRRFMLCTTIIRAQCIHIH